MIQLPYERERFRMEREYWTFQFSGAQMTEAVEASIAHHEGRLEFYRADLAEAEKDLRENGLTFEPRIGTYTSSETGEKAVIDPQKEKRCSIARSAIQDHQYRIDAYQAYLQAFISGGPERLYDLTVDDVEFFGIGKRVVFDS